jgi:hypothetical protein
MRVCISALLNDRTPHKRFTANASACRTPLVWGGRATARVKPARRSFLPRTHSLFFAKTVELHDLAGGGIVILGVRYRLRWLRIGGDGHCRRDRVVLL